MQGQNRQNRLGTMNGLLRVKRLSVDHKVLKGTLQIFCFLMGRIESGALEMALIIKGQVCSDLAVNYNEVPAQSRFNIDRADILRVDVEEWAQEAGPLPLSRR